MSLGTAVFFGAIVILRTDNARRRKLRRTPGHVELLLKFYFTNNI
jgi:hypothetical protein